jgi:hypothetical protein
MAFLLLVVILLMPLTAPAQDAAKAGAVVKGDVLYWEGDEIIVKEISGREVRVRVTPETKLEGVIGKVKTGDKIEAAVNTDGHAASIKLQLPDSGSGLGSPGLR